MQVDQSYDLFTVLSPIEDELMRGRDQPLRSDSIFAENVRAELDRILTSASLRIPERNRKLLRYVVEETLAGRADRIKAYSIATIAFGRDSSFDPQSDPIVRIEAGHIRRALERYYQTAGQHDPIRYVSIRSKAHDSPVHLHLNQISRSGFPSEIALRKGWDVSSFWYGDA